MALALVTWPPVTVSALRAALAPTAPPKLTLPAPAAIVRLWLPALVPFTVLLKVTALLVVVRVVLAPSVVAPV